MGRVVLVACLPWAGLLVALVVSLSGLARLNSARPEWGRLRGLHRDQGGAAQLEHSIFSKIYLFVLR